MTFIRLKVYNINVTLGFSSTPLLKRVDTYLNTKNFVPTTKMWSIFKLLGLYFKLFAGTPAHKLTRKRLRYAKVKVCWDLEASHVPTTKMYPCCLCPGIIHKIFIHSRTYKLINEFTLISMLPRFSKMKPPISSSNNFVFSETWIFIAI